MHPNVSSAGLPHFHQTGRKLQVRYEKNSSLFPKGKVLFEIVLFDHIYLFLKRGKCLISCQPATAAFP